MFANNNKLNKKEEIELTIVHLHVGLKHTISHVKISLKKIEEYFPLWKEIEANIQDMKETLDPRNVSLYWRACNDRWMPVYDYVTYRAALAQMRNHRLWLVVRDRDAQEEELCVAKMRASQASRWPERCAAHMISTERHPSVSHRARGADVRLLNRLFPPRALGPTFHGYTNQITQPTSEVLCTAQGTTLEPESDEDSQ